MREWGADGSVPLGRDGHHHEDGAGDEEALEGVEDVGEADAVPVGLGELLAPDERADGAVVQDVVDQQQGVHDG